MIKKNCLMRYKNYKVRVEFKRTSIVKKMSVHYRSLNVKKGESYLNKHSQSYKGESIG